MIDFKLSVVNGRLFMSYEPGDSFLNNILLSIYIKRGSFFAAPDVGSRLHTIKKITSNNVKLARDFIMESVQWMKDTARMVDLNVTTEADYSNNAINFSLSCKKQNGQDVYFSSFYPVV
jgi:phage gp46-like protein